MASKILLISPPFVQMNTPYPATTYLKGYLNTLGVDSKQIDLGIEAILEIFSKEGLKRIFSKVELGSLPLSDNAMRIYTMRSAYVDTISAVIDFLQNKNPTLSNRICSRNYLPEANRFDQAVDLDWAFGSMGTLDLAKHLATLYLEDISDFIVETVDPHFGFTRYAEKIAVSASSFDELYEALNSKNTFVDEVVLEILQKHIEEYLPTIVGFSVPFPGNLYSALKCGKWIKTNNPDIKVIMGGGYPNTELRSLSDHRVFEFVDYVSLDDGELPLKHLIEFIEGKRSKDKLKRTFLLNNGGVLFANGSDEKDINIGETGTPDYTGLPLDKYLSVIETLNPMHRLWGDGRWNKLTMAHGCYWSRCTFCDTSLDYISRFEPSSASDLCNRMERIISQTGQTGFHFVDEAAPPALMKSLALEIIRRKLNVTWWTNIRFEKSFSPDLCFLLKESGCIAVSGGLEVASNRLLGIINKGVSVEQASMTMFSFYKAGIMVHAYLMYGFPTQTAQETIDSLEIVRQLFEAGVVQSGFWHQFAMTAHSPVGKNPERFSVKKPDGGVGTFANNELECVDLKGTNHSVFGDGLRKALYNYMHGVGFDINLQKWFGHKVPKTTVQGNYIQGILANYIYLPTSPASRIIWLGVPPIENTQKTRKNTNGNEAVFLNFFLKKKPLCLKFSNEEANWILKTFQTISVFNEQIVTYLDLELDYEKKLCSDFLLFWNSKNIKKLREAGLLAL